MNLAPASIIAALTGVFFLTFRQGSRNAPYSGDNAPVLAKALPLIKHFEGFYGDAYTCSGGKLTIGYGHLVLPGESLVITKRAASNLLLQELSHSYLPDTLSALEDKGFDLKMMSVSSIAAMLSAVYNLGSGILYDGSWVQQYQHNKKVLASERFYLWSKASGNRLKGLVRRRFAEWQLFTSGSWVQHPPGYAEWYEAHK